MKAYDNFYKANTYLKIYLTFDNIITLSSINYIPNLAPDFNCPVGITQLSYLLTIFHEIFLLVFYTFEKVLIVILNDFLIWYRIILIFRQRQEKNRRII